MICDWWISIRFVCFCVSKLAACDRNYDVDGSEKRNRPFYRYGSHIELIRFEEYYGMPRGHEHDPIYSLSIYALFSGQFSFKFS